MDHRSRGLRDSSTGLTHREATRFGLPSISSLAPVLVLAWCFEGVERKHH